jgi:hypothetical protein
MQNENDKPLTEDASEIKIAKNDVLKDYEITKHVENGTFTSNLTPLDGIKADLEKRRI